MRTTYQSIHVAAPIEEVWQTVCDFHDFSWAPNVIQSCEKVGQRDGTTVGARRLLNGVFHETLLEHDPARHLISYSIDDGPSPVSSREVSDYRGTLRLRPVTRGGGTFVEWFSSWQSESDAGVDFCSNIYNALLDALRAACEARPGGS